MPVLGERRVVRNLLIEPQTREPAPRQMHAQLFHKLALAGDAVQIPDQQHAQQEFGINGGPTGFAVAVSQSFPYKPKTDMLVDKPQQMVLRNLIFQTEVIEQRF